MTYPLKKIQTTYFYLKEIRNQLIEHKFTKNSLPIDITIESEDYPYIWDSIQLATKTLKRNGIMLSMLLYKRTTSNKYQYTWKVSNIK